MLENAAVTVVLGQADLVAEALAIDVQLVVNELADGQMTSVHCGLAAAGGEQFHGCPGGYAAPDDR